ncbi:hypothetical protein HanRHA438_Chr02g0066131 [Helianthus annuus]|nr:hypothetical protein HanRHA438_Chr02g0066131 [Helianthus annuus]
MAKGTCCSDPAATVSPPPISPESQTNRFNDFLLESFLHVSDFDSINTAFDTLIESRSSDSDKHDLIQRSLHIGSILLEAGKRSDQKRSLFHNAVVWPLPPDLTIKCFGFGFDRKRSLVVIYGLYFRSSFMIFFFYFLKFFNFLIFLFFVKFFYFLYIFFIFFIF